MEIVQAALSRGTGRSEWRIAGSTQGR